MINDIDDTNKYPCMKCFETKIFRSQNNVKCRYYSAWDGFTREEFLVRNLMSDMSVFEVKGPDVDIQLHIHLLNEEE